MLAGWYLGKLIGKATDPRDPAAEPVGHDPEAPVEGARRLDWFNRSTGKWTVFTREAPSGDWTRWVIDVTTGPIAAESDAQWHAGATSR